MATGASSCRPIRGCCGGGRTFAFFLGGWPCSGGGEKRVPSARWHCSVTDTYPAAVITGIRARVSSPANNRHTASKQGTYSYPSWRLGSGTCLADPKWARRASRTAVVVMVSWREAGGGAHARLGGGGGGGAGLRMPPARGPSRPGPGAGASMGPAGGPGLG